MPKKYLLLYFLILLCGICIIFGGICQEPILILVIIGMIIVICLLVISMFNDNNE